MIMSTTERLGLPLLTPGQAQKEFFHNEALQALDALVAGCVEGLPQNGPPAAPAPGSSYIVGSAPAAEWATHAGAVASWTSGGWRFQPPAEGMALRVRGSGMVACFRSGAWEVGVLRGSSLAIDGVKVVGAQASAIADPSGGTVVDVDARAALAAVLGALRSHGLIRT
jgi:hypothetical protein